MQTRCIKETKEFEKLKEPWNALLAQNHTRSAFLTWEWLFSWWQTYADKKELWIITTWQDDELVGIMPFARIKEKQNGLNFRTLVPLGSPQSDVSGILVKNLDEEILTHMGEYLLEEHKAWHTFELNYYTQDDPALRFLKDFFQQKGVDNREKKHEHFYISLHQSWEEYLRTLARKFKYNLRRAERLAGEKGEVKFEFFAGGDLRWNIFEKIIQINKEAHYPLLYDSTKEQEFHKKLVEQNAITELVAVFLLSVDDIPLAYEYGFVHNERYEAWRSGFDTRFDSKISIGKLLAKLMVKTAFALNYNEIDFLRGDEAYKLEWKPESRIYLKNRFVRKNSIVPHFIFIRFPVLRKRIKQLLKSSSTQTGT